MQQITENTSLLEPLAADFPAQAAAERPKPKHKTLRRTLLLTAVLLPFAMVGIVLYGFYTLLEMYERYSPLTPVRELVACLQRDDYAQVMQKLNLHTDALNHEAQFREAWDAAYGTEREEVTYYEDAQRATDTTRACYAQFGKHTAGFVLTAKREIAYFGFRFHEWSLALEKPIAAATQTIVAPSHATVTVNGTALDVSYRTDIRALTHYDNLTVAPPKVTETVYTVPGLWGTPQVTATLKDGTACAATRQKDDTIAFTAPLPETDRAALETLTEQSARALVEFIAYDKAFSELAVYLYPKTTFYQSTRRFDAKWFNTHQASGFEKIALRDERSYDTDHASVTISFVYYIKVGSRRYDYPTTYTVYSARLGGKWQVTDMVMA